MIPLAPTIPHRDAPALAAPQLRAGNGTRITHCLAGQSVSMQGSTWHHPWFTTVCWNAAEKEWIAIVRPGFVNGRAPVVQTTGKRMQSTPSFLAPVTAWDGAADIKQAAELATEDENETVDPDASIWVALYRNPPLTLTWGSCGSDDMPIPAYFLRRGNWIATSGRDSSKASTGWAASGRRLYSSDIVLHQPRNALTSLTDYPVDVGAGSSIVTQTLSERTATANDRLKILSMANYAAIDPYAVINALLGDYEEPTWDELLLARVFLLSPPNTTGSPDGSWTPFVQHKAFWNLNWYQPSLGRILSDSGVSFIQPLAGGAAQLVISSMLGLLNDEVKRAINVLSAHSLAGTFWTPTGGGHDSAFPSTTATETAVKYGLRKDLRNKAARVAALNAGILVDTLDPVFPYSAMPFSLSLL